MKIKEKRIAEKFASKPISVRAKEIKPKVQKKSKKSESDEDDEENEENKQE